MLVVFSERSIDALADQLGMATWYNEVKNEDLEYCIRREHAVEILTCRKMGIPYVVLQELGFRGNQGGESLIIDCNVDINELPDGTRFILRVREKPHACWMETLSRFEAFTPFESDCIMHWPNHVQQPERFLKRTVIDVREEIMDEMLADGAIKTPVFIKGVDKGREGMSLHHVFEDQAALRKVFKTPDEIRSMGLFLQDELRTTGFQALLQNPDWYCPYRDSMEPGKRGLFNAKKGFQISDVLEFKHEADHKAEYRAFIVDGKVTSLSAYVDYESKPVPELIRTFAQEFATVHRELASSFVADFGVTSKGPVLIEMNDLSFSGRYLDNCPFALFSAFREAIGPVYTPTLLTPQVPTPDKDRTPSPDDEIGMIDQKIGLSIDQERISLLLTDDEDEPWLDSIGQLEP